MITCPVVPTLATAPTKNQLLGQFLAASSERRANDGVSLFDRAVGRMFRRAEAREEYAVLRDARAITP